MVVDWFWKGAAVFVALASCSYAAGERDAKRLATLSKAREGFFNAFRGLAASGKEPDAFRLHTEIPMTIQLFPAGRADRVFFINLGPDSPPEKSYLSSLSRVGKRVRRDWYVELVHTGERPSHGAGTLRSELLGNHLKPKGRVSRDANAALDAVRPYAMYEYRPVPTEMTTRFVPSSGGKVRDPVDEPMAFEGAMYSISRSESVWIDRTREARKRSSGLRPK